MTIDDQNSSNTEPFSQLSGDATHKMPRKPMPRRTIMAIGAVALLFVGAMAGAETLKLMHSSAEMAPATPVSISALPAWGLVTVKGQVAEIFGNKFVVQDVSGRALVETGRAGEGGKLVAKDEAVTVQGQFENGFIHARFIVHPDGRVETIGGPGHPPGPGLRGLLHRLVGDSQLKALTPQSKSMVSTG